MEVLNKVGIDVLEYKKELSDESHSKIVKRALHNAVNSLVSGDIITPDIQDAIQNEDVSIDDVRQLILDVPALRKTKEELEEEYQKLLQPLFESLEDEDLMEGEAYAKLYSESHVEDEKVTIIHAFEMTSAFVGEYFGVDGDKLDALVRPEGFAEKFALSRYSAIMKKLLASFDGYNNTKQRVLVDNGLEIAITPVYVNRDEGIYGIEMVHHIPIGLLEDKEQTEVIQEVIREKIKQANDYVDVRMKA